MEWLQLRKEPKEIEKNAKRRQNKDKRQFNGTESYRKCTMKKNTQKRKKKNKRFAKRVILPFKARHPICSNIYKTMEKDA